MLRGCRPEQSREWRFRLNTEKVKKGNQLGAQHPTDTYPKEEAMSTQHQHLRGLWLGDLGPLGTGMTTVVIHRLRKMSRKSNNEVDSRRRGGRFGLGKAHENSKSQMPSLTHRLRTRSCCREERSTFDRDKWQGSGRCREPCQLASPMDNNSHSWRRSDSFLLAFESNNINRPASTLNLMATLHRGWSDMFCSLAVAQGGLPWCMRKRMDLRMRVSRTTCLNSQQEGRKGWQPRVTTMRGSCR